MTYVNLFSKKSKEKFYLSKNEVIQEKKINYFPKLRYSLTGNFNHL